MCSAGGGGGAGTHALSKLAWRGMAYRAACREPPQVSTSQACWTRLKDATPPCGAADLVHPVLIQKPDLVSSRPSQRTWCFMLASSSSSASCASADRSCQGGRSLSAAAPGPPLLLSS